LRSLGALSPQGARPSRGSVALGDELKKKRLEVLEEATPLILSLPDSVDKARLLRQASLFYLADKRGNEAKALYPVILTIIENIENVHERFQLYAELFQPDHPNAAGILEKMHTIAEQTDLADHWRTLFSSHSRCIQPDPYSPLLRLEPADALVILEKMEAALERMEKSLIVREDGFIDGNRQFVTKSRQDISLKYLSFYRPDQPGAAEILEKIQASTAKIDDPFSQMVVLFNLWTRYARSFPSTPHRKEAFDKALNAILNEDVQRMTRLGWMIGDTSEEETDLFVDAVMEFVSSPNISDTEKGQVSHLMEQINRKLLEQKKFDKAVELASFPQITDVSRKSLRSDMMYALILLEDAEFETRKDDFWKLFDLIETPQEKFRMLDNVLVPYQKLNAPEDWKKRLEIASEISDPRAKFNAFATLLSWTGRSYRNATWMENGKEFRSMLLETMEEIAEAETDPIHKTRFYGEILLPGRLYGMWDAQRIADWQEKYDATLAHIPNANDRFSALHRLVFAEVGVIQINDFRQARINTLLAAARDIPEHNYRNRLVALLETATIAHDYARNYLPELAHEILDEAYTYAGTIPADVRRSREVNGVLERLNSLRDRMTR
jgi:hypothetical protein